METINKKIQEYLKSSEDYDDFYEQAQDEIRKKLQVFTEEDIKREATHIWDEFCFNSNPLK